MPEYLTVEDICKILQIKKTKAYDMMHDKYLHAVKLGGTIRVSKENFLKYLERREIR